MKIKHLRLSMTVAPVVPDGGNVRVRTFAGPSDIAVWLEVQRRAFANVSDTAARWDTAWFRREFIAQPWWSPERLWFAEVTETAEVVGTVALASRGVGACARPAIHWLAVVPEWQRQGVGQLLLAIAHRAAWDDGFRIVRAETHSDWSAAMRLYASQGYE